MHSLLECSKKNSDYIISIRRQLHQFPETDLDLPRAKELICNELTKMGLTPVAYGNSGITVDITGNEGDQIFLLRADMDALPIVEETDLPFASSNGNMHACGHDCHASMLLGAAKLLQEERQNFRGTIRLLFQPGEEIMQGATEAIKNHILNNVNAAMMIHIVSGIPAPTGSCGVFGAGTNYASVDWFRVDIQGKGGHGAQPHEAISPFDTLVPLYTYIQEMEVSSFSAGESYVVSIGEIHGGSSANIIPDSAYFTGTIRTFNENVRAQIKEKLASAVEKYSSLRKTTAKISFYSSAPCLVSDASVRESVLTSATELLGEKAFDLNTAFGGAAKKVMSSEDFAYIAEQVPSSAVWLIAGSPEEGYTYPLHHPKTAFDDSVLYLGSALYAKSAMDWLNNH